MKRGIVLGTLVAAGVLTAAVGAVQQAPRVVTAEKLKDNLYVMRGGGGNSAVFVGATSVTVVDTKNPGWRQPLLDEIPAKYTGYAEPQAVRLRSNVEVTYNEIR
jgi:hypothetical protein